MRDRQRVRDSARLLKEKLAVNGNHRPHDSAPSETAVKNDDLFKSCFAHAAIGFSISDLDGRLLEVNPAYCAITGYSETELRLTFDLQTLTHPEDLPLALEKVRALKEGEIPAFIIEKRYVRKDESVVWVQNSVSLIRDEAGRPTHIVRLTQDITEHKLTEVSLRQVQARNEAILVSVATNISHRKRAQSARRTAERKYRQIFENAGEGIFQSTPGGCYLTANPALAHIHGFDSPRELIQSCRDISHQIYVDPARRDEFKRLLEMHGVVRGFEHETFRKDGRKIWISVNARAVRDDTGKVLYYEGTVQDISERKQAEHALRESEERYRELFENSKDAIYVHDMSGRYTSINRAAEKLSGYTREQLIGRHFSSLVTPEYARQVREHLCKKLEAAGETTYEVELITKEGERLPVEVSSRLIIENGLPVGVQGCVRDVSERKRAQEAARKYSRRLIEAQEAERRRISLELHDQVGQILTAVKMNLHALQKKCSARDVLASIGENLNAIDEAFDQVRDLSVDLRPLLLDDFGLVVAVRWYLDRQGKNSGMPFEFISLSLNEEERFTTAVETACFRIVQEGVTNIIRHARASRISVRLERTGSDLMLLITDNGAGFDVKSVRGAATGAATLGLRGMEERALAVGGTLTIDSAPGLGTQICASFPCPFISLLDQQIKPQIAGQLR